MDTVRMVATAKLDYAGKHLVADDEFDCEPQHVHVWETLGKARKAQRPEWNGWPKGQYQTRDMATAQLQTRAPRGTRKPKQ